MDDRSLYNIVHGARENPSARYSALVEQTLEGLPRVQKRRRRTDMRRKWRYAAAVIGGLLLIALAGPPIVRAASAFLQHIFSSRVENIDAELARPTGERVQEIMERYEQFGYEQSFDLAGTQIGDMTARITSICLWQDENGGWWMPTNIEFLNPPQSFDPAWVEYVLHVDGREIPVDADYNAFHRKQGDVRVAAFATEWTEDAETGTLIDSPFFTIGSLDDIEQLDMEISAEIYTLKAGGEKDQLLGEMRLPFTFNKQIALMQTQQEVTARMEWQNEMLETEKARMQELAAEAVPIGAAVQIGNAHIALDEISLLDGWLHSTFSISGEVEDILADKTDVVVDSIQVDQYVLRPNGSGEEELETAEGASRMYFIPLARDPRQLPEISLIRFGMGCDEEAAVIVFRYNWADKTAILPADMDEEKDWLAEAKAMRVEDPFPSEVREAAVDFAEEVDGVTLRVERIETRSGRMQFYLDAAQLQSDDDFMVIDCKAAIDGLPAVDALLM